MYWRKLAAWAAIAPAVFAPVLTNAQLNAGKDCWYSDEIPSVHVQTFQTMLMVGTFKCRDIYPEAIESYNKFMNSKRDFILANQRVVQAHFTRQLGTEPGNIAYLSHQTRVGNSQSLAGLSLSCEKVTSLSRLAASASESGLFELARFVNGDAALTVCAHPAEPVAVADAVTTEAGAPPKVVATVAADQAPGPEENLAPGHFVPEGPVTATPTPAVAPAPAKMIAVAEEKPAAAPVEAVAPATAAPAAPTAAQALQEAAKALALAATALQAQAAPAAEPVATPAVVSKD